MNHTLIKKYSVQSRGKSKGFSFNMELNIPELSGIVDSKTIGGLFVNELIDYIRDNWSKGREVGGSPRLLKKKTIKRRKIKQAMLENMPDDRVEYQKMIRGLRKQGKISGYVHYYSNYIDEIRRLKKHYYFRVVSTQLLNGIKTRKSVNTKFVPDASNNTAINDSGLMVASLRGKFKPSRSYINKSTGQRVNVSSEVVLSVAKSRQQAALEAGLSKNAASYLISKLNTNNAAFKNTSKILKEGIYWADQRADFVKMIIVLRLIYRTMKMLK